jgi:hypothetical protein
MIDQSRLTKQSIETTNIIESFSSFPHGNCWNFVTYRVLLCSHSSLQIASAIIHWQQTTLTSVKAGDLNVIVSSRGALRKTERMKRTIREAAKLLGSSIVVIVVVLVPVVHLLDA